MDIKKHKEPSLFRKLIDIHFEQSKRRKALRTLVKQEWSVEFITALIAKASKYYDQNIIFTIESKNGIKLNIESKSAVNSSEKLNDSSDIFDHLDNDAAIESFIRSNSTR